MFSDSTVSENGGAMINAHENQWGRQGNARERTQGDAVRLPVGPYQSSHSYPGRKLAANAAKVFHIKTALVH
jgi:hypothetical protein